MQHGASPDTVRTLADRNIQRCEKEMEVEVEVERFLIEELGIATLAIVGKLAEVHDILVK